MAYIDFEGVDPTDPEFQRRSVMRVSIPDSVMLMSVQAICVNSSYNPESEIGPGTFAIQQIVKFCTDQVKAYETQKAAETARLAKADELAPLESSISIEQVE